MNGLKIFKKHASFGSSLLFLSLTLYLAISVNAFAKGLPDFTELVESSSPAVVNIRTIATQGGLRLFLAFQMFHSWMKMTLCMSFLSDFFHQITVEDKDLLLRNVVDHPTEDSQEGLEVVFLFLLMVLFCPITT